MSRTMPPGRGWAYTGATLGGLVSIAANVAHSFLPPTGAPPGWTPAPMAIVFAICWPVFLFVAVEMLARTPWPRRLNWALVKWGGLLPVATVAAAVSYRHLSGLLTHYGEERFVALVGPLAVDGLMVMATGALIATGRRRTQPAPDPAAAPADPGTPAAPTSTPFAETPTGPTDPKPSTAPADPDPVAVVPPPVIPSPAELAARITPTRPAAPAASDSPSRSGSRTARRPAGRPATPAAAQLAPSTTDIPVSESDAAQLTLPVPVPPDLLTRATKAATDYHTEHGTPITAGQLAVRLKVTSEQANQVLLALTNSDNPTTPTVNGNRPHRTAR